ncbi:MAG: glycosyltransferase [Anaerovoracaceae bacterium]
MIDHKELLVSVVCTTYNHEAYVRQALEGFVMQKTNFSFEVIVHDDASTDSTVQIIKEYESKYPNLFRNIYQIENQYSQRKDIWGNLFCNYCAGKYIAICEGDDYWTDPLKLQKQVDFLEVNLEYGLCHTECDVFYQEQKLWKRNYNSLKMLDNNMIYPPDILLEKILSGRYFIKTASVLVRRVLIDVAFQKLKQQKFPMGDTPLWATLSQITKFYYFQESMIVYRRVANSASNQCNIEKYLHFKLGGAEMRLSFKNDYPFSKSFQQKIQQDYNKYYLNYSLFNPQIQSIFPLIDLTSMSKIKVKICKIFMIRVSFKYCYTVYYKTYFSLIAAYRLAQKILC